MSCFSRILFVSVITWGISLYIHQEMKSRLVWNHHALRYSQYLKFWTFAKICLLTWPYLSVTQFTCIWVGYLTTLSVSRQHIVGYRIINKGGAVGGMRIQKGNWSTLRKSAPLPLCPPQIPHDLTWDWSRRLTTLFAWADSTTFERIYTDKILPTIVDTLKFISKSENSKLLTIKPT
jgi:hypothetical protein